jgi:hypothetical protein
MFEASRLFAQRFLFVVLLAAFFASSALAEYFEKKSFKPYSASGVYPFWSETWVPLGNRIEMDRAGIPYVSYREGTTYNATTISLYGLLAYNRYLKKDSPESRAEFLKFAQWLVIHQNHECGCWYHELDTTYVALDETLRHPWPSAMTQGLAISVLTRAYHLTQDKSFLNAANQALPLFKRPVEQGGVRRDFTVLPASPSSDSLPYFEEYPTKPSPSFTLNGFLYSLVGLYDLSQAGNAEAEELFRNGTKTVSVCLPFYDLGDGSSYDLVHLTRPPREVHRDRSYHFVHITMLNAVGTAAGDGNLLWYRDKWNSYGMQLDTTWEWMIHFFIWLVFKHKYLLGMALLLLFLAGFYLLWLGWTWSRTLRHNQSPLPVGNA